MPTNYGDVGKPMTVLVNLELEHVALVKEGANSRADILLTKGRKENNMPKTFDELMAELQPEAATVVKSHIETVVTTKTAELTTQVGTLSAEVTKLKEGAPASAAKPAEDIFKGLSAEAKSYIEGLQSNLTSLISQQEDARINANFEKCKALNADEAKLKAVLKAASPATIEILTAAAAAVEASVLNKGKGTSDDGTPPTGANAHYETLHKAAQKLQQGNAALTYEVAFTKACEENPTIYAKYVREV